MNTLTACLKIMFGGDKSNPPKMPAQSRKPDPVHPDRIEPERAATPVIVNEDKPMTYLRKSTRNIDTAFVHSSATKPSMNIGRDEIDEWHRERGFDEIGYQLVIRRDGSTEIGRDVDKNGAHTRGHNRGSIGIVMIGGLSDGGKAEANFTKAQFATLSKVLSELVATYPGLKIKGHRDVGPTACPSFDVQHWLKTGEVRP